jgi:hypothetical protein
MQLSLEKRIRVMEKDLTPDNIAAIYREIIDQLFTRGISKEESDKLMADFERVYIDTLDRETLIRVVNRMHKVEINRWAFTYFKSVLMSLELKISFIQNILALMVVNQKLEDANCELKRCNPNKVIKEDASLKWIKKLNVGELRDMIAETEGERKEIIEDENLWDNIGYPVPKEICQLEELQEDNG